MSTGDATPGPGPVQLPRSGAIAVFLDRLAVVEAVLAEAGSSTVAGSSSLADVPDDTRDDIPVVPAPVPAPGLIITRQLVTPARRVPVRKPRRGRHRKKRDGRKRALHRWQLALLAAVVIPVVLGATMTALHGPAFFIFRASGTGQSPDSALAENQGPGQPDAPGNHAARRRKPATAFLTATAPDGTRITVPAVPGQPGLAWAGIAQRVLDGRWAVIADGVSQASVRQATAIHFNRHSSEYAPAWSVVQLRRT